MTDEILPAPEEIPDGWRTSVVGPGDGAFDRALRVEFDVFKEMGYTESSAGFCAEYDPWQRDSRMATVVDERDQIRGLVRLIIGDYSELPVGKLPTDRQTPTGRVLEYASLAVLPGDRKTGVAEALYKMVWEESVRANVDHLSAVVDPWLHDLLVDHYGFPFEMIGPQTRYMGGNVVPISMVLAEVHATLPTSRPEFARWVFSGVSDVTRKSLGIDIVEQESRS